MAGRNWRSNRIYNQHVFPVQLDAQVSIGSSGDPTLVTSSTVPGSSPTATQMQSMGIKSITRLAAGIYQIRLDDNFSSLLSLDARFTAPLTGSAIQVDTVTAGLTVGVVYQIVTLGTSTTANWQTLGLPTGVTPTVGMPFLAAATGAGSGTGTVKAIGSNAVGVVEIIGVTPDNMLNSQPFVQGSGGGYITFQCRGSAGTVSAPTFTGSALGNHTHNLTLKNAAVSDGATTRVNAGSNLLGANTGSDITITGAGANGGVANASAGTPAGTISAPTFTSTPTATDPSASTTMYLRILLSNSSIS